MHKKRFCNIDISLLRYEIIFYRKQMIFYIAMIFWISFPRFSCVRDRHWQYDKDIWQNVFVLLNIVIFNALKNYNTSLYIDKIFEWLFSGCNMKASIGFQHVSGNSFLNLSKYVYLTESKSWWLDYFVIITHL